MSNKKNKPGKNNKRNSQISKSTLILSAGGISMLFLALWLATTSSDEVNLNSLTTDDPQCSPITNQDLSPTWQTSSEQLKLSLANLIGFNDEAIQYLTKNNIAPADVFSSYSTKFIDYRDHDAAATMMVDTLLLETNLKIYLDNPIHPDFINSGSQAYYRAQYQDIVHQAKTDIPCYAISRELWRAWVALYNKNNGINIIYSAQDALAPNEKVGLGFAFNVRNTTEIASLQKMIDLGDKRIMTYTDLKLKKSLRPNEKSTLEEAEDIVKKYYYPFRLRKGLKLSAEDVTMLQQLDTMDENYNLKKPFHYEYDDKRYTLVLTEIERTPENEIRAQGYFCPKGDDNLGFCLGSEILFEKDHPDLNGRTAKDQELNAFNSRIATIMSWPVPLRAHFYPELDCHFGKKIKSLYNKLLKEQEKNAKKVLQSQFTHLQSINYERLGFYKPYNKDSRCTHRNTNVQDRNQHSQNQLKQQQKIADNNYKKSRKVK
ncbi:MAG: hypothetical protein KIT27_01980 [Legionellales bacterium]|nr:hypothetical protein [Legionellales bacterium]